MNMRKPLIGSFIVIAIGLVVLVLGMIFEAGKRSGFNEWYAQGFHSGCTHVLIGYTDPEDIPENFREVCGRHFDQ